MKRIAILGSTGSIGRNTLEVIRNFPDKFRVSALSVNSDIRGLARQVRAFKPALVCITEKSVAQKFKARAKPGLKVFSGHEGLEELLKDKRIEMVVLAISGAGCLKPLISAIKNKKEIALANKEALVMAGPIISKIAKDHRVKIIPIDSEQSAIWQCLKDEERKNIKNIYLTASGGPFLGFKKSRLKNIVLGDALKHPRWKMGKKITVDSATLMNKGLEVLEAMYLFGIGPDKIKVIIHPQSIIHSMVEFTDGVILAQMSVTDMRIPIQYALSYPQRLTARFGRLDFLKLKSLNFSQPDFENFPCLGLAYRAAYAGGSMPAVLNAANEVAVGEFLKNRIKFTDIPELIKKVMDCHCTVKNPEIDDILAADKWARDKAKIILKN
jgi:1-deoxy-D-xylulose-5-phosphate reductoisomerase